MRRAVAVLSVVAVIALLGLSTASAAEELWVIKDGILDKKALTPAATKPGKGYVQCEGDTVGGPYEGPCMGPSAKYHGPGTARLSSCPAEETEPDGGIVVGIFRKADGPDVSGSATVLPGNVG